MGKSLNTKLQKTGQFSLAFFLCFIFFFNQSKAQKKEQIRLLNSDVLESATHNGKKARKLIGNVQFSHKDAIMYCDSAFMYSAENAIDAYGSVHINQGDTLNLYGDFLHYDGNSRIATVKGKKVRLVKPDLTLTTTELIFNRITNEANYSHGGVIESKTDDNVLSSVKGNYQTDKNVFTFKDSVVLNNPSFVMHSDTLIYYNLTKIVVFVGPTTIQSEENFIYCERGWYDTDKDLSQYYRNAYMISDNRKLEGDSLFYDRNKGFGRAVQNVQITDTSENIQINGETALMYEKNDSAVVYGKSLLTQLFDKDSLFMHADTFKIYGNDTNERQLFAYYGVRIYKSDLQGSCDSMVYSISDSTIKLRGNPILWSEENQLTGVEIDIYTKDNKIHSIFLNQAAFIISSVDSIRYNQIKGKKMYGYFKDSELHKIEVRGNGQTTYYGQDEEDKFIGVNVAESSDINIKMQEREIHSITFLNKPEATMHPIGALDPVLDLRYPGFQWLIDLRPKSQKDIFKKPLIVED